MHLGEKQFREKLEKETPLTDPQKRTNILFEMFVMESFWHVGIYREIINIQTKEILTICRQIRAHFDLLQNTTLFKSV